MLLAGTEILKATRSGEIAIDPFSPDQVNPNSYNYRLGSQLLLLNRDSGPTSISIPDQGFLLLPRHIYLARTHEYIESSRFVITLLGRSSVGRLGLFVNITADLGHLGSSSCWTLELTAIQPLRVYPGMVIGQIAFWEPSDCSSRYQGAYLFDRYPKENKRHKRHPHGGYK